MPSTSKGTAKKGSTKKDSTKEGVTVKDPGVKDSAVKVSTVEPSNRKLSLRKYSNTFLLFPKLPAEIRLIIWTMAANRRRVLELRKKQGPDGIVSCLSTIPAVLHATYESRHVALKFYKKAFNISWRNRPITETTYVNYSADIILVTHRILVRSFKYVPHEFTDTLRKVHHVILHGNEDVGEEYLWSFFRSLKTMVLQTPAGGLDPTGEREREIRERLGVAREGKWDRGAIEVDFMTQEEMVSFAEQDKEIDSPGLFDEYSS